jgi:tetratricopeptide (TPR) repeat protein
MDTEKSSSKQNAKTVPTAKAPPLKTPPPPAAPAHVAPLFRKLDWFAMLFVFAVIWAIYLYTLAPEQTLEDSGELCTGAFYAGIPHPPGYPFWAIYAWVWTKVLWFGNVAWRVEVGESFGSAIACGLVALMVSRGSSMIMEGIEELKEMKGKWEGAICVVSGATAGLLLGFGGVMWSESVAINRISLFGVVWVALVLTLVLRWIYAPHQRRYLYWAMFCFGICATIHQTLLTMAVGIEVAVAMAQPRLGRDLFLGNGIIYVLALIGKATHFTTMLDTAPMMLIIFHAVGFGSIAACILLTIRTSELGTEWLPVLIMGGLWLAGASFYFYEPIAGMTNPPMEWGYPRTVEGFFHALTRGQYEKAFPSEVFKDPGRFIGQLWYLINGVAEEYSWAFLAVALLPFFFLFRMQKRERAWLVGLAAVYGCIGVLLVIIMNPSPDRQSVELLKVFFTSSRAVVAVLIGYGLTLVAAYMATHYMKFRVWGLIGGGIAVLLALYTLNDATGRHYFGYEGKVGYGAMWHWIGVAFQKDQGGLPIIGNLVLVAVAVGFLIGLAIYGRRAPLAITLGLFAITPLYSAFVHYDTSEQRHHWYGFWFGHDMFTPPFTGPDGKLTYDAKLREQMMKDPAKGKLIYPEMDRHTVLYGGTDPGRFCPTYSIFCDSFIPDNCKPVVDPTFDRRDVYLITQNALADGTYLNYLRAQYNRSQQIDPPFFSELARYVLKDKEYETNLLAKMVSPLDWIFEARGARIEKRWRTSTSMFDDQQFTNFPALAGKLREHQDPVSKWLFDNFSKETQDLLSQKADENRTRDAVIKDLNTLLERELDQKELLKKKQQEKEEVDQKISDGDTSSRLQQKSEELAKEIATIKIEPLYETNRFAQVEMSDHLKKFLAQNPQGDTRIRLNRLLLEAAYPNEIVKSKGGVYPDREIYMATNEDSQRCFQEYIQDAQQRIMHDQQFPNEQRQVKPGEDVHIVDNRVQVSGQIAVMSINGLLTKVIFDHNPDHEFYIEESFPLDWMFPNLTPFGIIMKINRQPLPELTQDICDRDHEFWSKYSDRLIGNWITYDTSVKDIVAWVEKVYMRHDYSGYKGDLKFAHDDEAQKAFSKLRSSIGGIYSWRLGVSPSGGPVPPQWIEHREPQRTMLLHEANFAFKQAFAYCPYSPEAVYRYIQLLTSLEGRFDDALLIAETCHKLDPENSQVTGLVNNLRQYKGQPSAVLQVQKEIAEMESKFRSNQTDYTNAFALASKYMSIGQDARAFQILDGIAGSTDTMAVWSVVQAYATMQNVPKAASALAQYVKIAPGNPEGWYNLAKTDVVLGKTNDAVEHLGEALKIRPELKPQAQKDFAPLASTPGFKALMSAP